MSGEWTERDVEALAAVARSLTYGTPRNVARAVLCSDWYAERIAQARREGAAEVAERVETDVLSGWQAEAEDRSAGVNVVIGVEVVLSSVRAALRGDAR